MSDSTSKSPASVRHVEISIRLRASALSCTTSSRPLRVQADAGLDLAQSSLTVGELLERWKRDVLPGRGSASTVANYSGAIDRHLVPHLGRHKLDQLRAEHVETMLRSLAAAGVRQRT